MVCSNGIVYSAGYWRCDFDCLYEICDACHAKGNNPGPNYNSNVDSELRDAAVAETVSHIDTTDPKAEA